MAIEGYRMKKQGNGPGGEGESRQIKTQRDGK